MSASPEVVESIAKSAAVKQTADQHAIERIADDIRDLKLVVNKILNGQNTIIAALKTLTNQTQALVWTRIVWPSLAVITALALGGFSGALVWRIVNR